MRTRPSRAHQLNARQSLIDSTSSIDLLRPPRKQRREAMKVGSRNVKLDRLKPQISRLKLKLSLSLKLQQQAQMQQPHRAAEATRGQRQRAQTNAPVESGLRPAETSPEGRGEQVQVRRLGPGQGVHPGSRGAQRSVRAGREASRYVERA